MRVQLHEVDQTTHAKTLVADEVALAECFPDDPEAQHDAEAQLRADGFAFVGGGAAQLYLLSVALPH